MSEAEKPLHVRVAEALGWSQFEVPNGLWPKEFIGYPPKSPIIGKKESVPAYDTDWAATGPLIEKYGIDVGPRAPWDGTTNWWVKSGWDACKGDGSFSIVQGETALIAVCNLLLKMKEKGTL